MQFGLRSLLVLVTGFAMLFALGGWEIAKNRHGQQAIEELTEAGAFLITQPRRVNWLAGLLGDETAGKVNCLVLFLAVTDEQAHAVKGQQMGYAVFLYAAPVGTRVPRHFDPANAELSVDVADLEQELAHWKRLLDQVVAPADLKVYVDAQADSEPSQLAHVFQGVGFRAVWVPDETRNGYWKPFDSTLTSFPQMGRGG